MRDTSRPKRSFMAAKRKEMARLPGEDVYGCGDTSAFEKRDMLPMYDISSALRDTTTHYLGTCDTNQLELVVSLM